MSNENARDLKAFSTQLPLMAVTTNSKHIADFKPITEPQQPDHYGCQTQLQVQ